MNDSRSHDCWLRTKAVDVVFDQRHRALAGLDFACDAGEFVAVVGPSGCGKSTLLRLIAGLQPPTAGHLDRGWTDDGARVGRVGFVFQHPNLLPWRNVLNNIALPLELSGVARLARLEAARRARQRVGLKSEDDTKLPRMLSGGMQMRVSVARALVTEPSVMLMDEPFAAVDDLLRTRLNEELVALWRQQAWTTIFVTHHVHEAVFVSQRVLVMSPAPGRIIDQVEVPLSYPRTLQQRGSAEFAALANTVSCALREASA